MSKFVTDQLSVNNNQSWIFGVAYQGHCKDHRGYRPITDTFSEIEEEICGSSLKIKTGKDLRNIKVSRRRSDDRD